MNVDLMTEKKGKRKKTKLSLEICSGVICHTDVKTNTQKISRKLCAILGGAAKPGKYAVLMHMHV